MFYEPKNGHGLPHSPFNAIVAPRPIGWISTRGSQGDNLAPYSFFNALAYDPPQVMFSGGLKDSIRNVQETGVFAVNVVSEGALPQMNVTSTKLPRGTDEFVQAGVEKAECNTISCPRVAMSPATLECRASHILPLLGDDNDWIVIAEVTGIHIREEYMTDGRLDLTKVRPAARLGYRDYAIITSLFELSRPDDPL
jgi:flavin reductase (DIM6/NTAB) family NADH-FMN oxidoreductase RutF